MNRPLRRQRVRLARSAPRLLRAAVFRIPVVAARAVGTALVNVIPRLVLVDGVVALDIAVAAVESGLDAPGTLAVSLAAALRELSGNLNGTASVC